MEKFSISLRIIPALLNSIRCDSGRYDLTHNLENVVYNELIYMGYKVTVYDNLGREIDFLQKKEIIDIIFKLRIM